MTKFAPALMAALFASTLFTAPLAAQEVQTIEQIPEATSADLASEQERLKAARRVVDLLIPKDDYAGYAKDIIGPTLEVLDQQVLAIPQISDAINEYPSIRPVFEEFITEEREAAIALTVENLPLLSDAMTSAYAARLSLENLITLGDFFEQPAGKAYVATSRTILTDPAIIAAQQQMAEASFANVGERIDAFTAKIADAVAADAQAEEGGEAPDAI